MGWFQKLRARAVEHLWSFLFGVFWKEVVGGIVTLLIIIFGIIKSVPQPWLYVCVGAVIAFAFILIIKMISFILRPKYLKRKLSILQKEMLKCIGAPSGGPILYQSILRDLQIAAKEKPRTHSERRKLERLGLVLYSNGQVELTDKGFQLYDILLEQEEGNIST